ncbi:DUF1367 family protein [Candidatus Parcubacteria bacterium]|nr:MAG: DUF1367 family protein [Candidatus Parcubacteria bacterium]
MAKAVFAKAPNGQLVPADDAAEQLLDSIRPGQGISVEARKARNIRFHRKFFALLRLAYDHWQEISDGIEWKGRKVRPTFEQFREDVLILAGYYNAYYTLHGSVRLRARSISFANCDEREFERIYRAVFDVLWERVFSVIGGYGTEADVEAAVEQFLAFS